MNNLHNIRLTDDLERQLIAQAIEEEQYRVDFAGAFKKLFARLASLNGKPSMSGQPQESAA